MSDSVTDFYHQKTDAELQFFVDHPAHYQPSIVAAARQELRRRGVLAPPPFVPIAPEHLSTHYEEPSTASRRITLLVSLGLLLVLGFGIYRFKQQSTATTAALKAQEEARRHLPPPTLTEVATSAIPNYDGPAAAAAAQQLRQIPARERANAQHMRQFRELVRRFWAAETQSEYLVNQAYAGKAGPHFVDQTVVVRETWGAWNHAYVYTYDFGPVMKAQLSRMGEAASHQQHILDTLPDLLAGNEFRKDDEMLNRTADVQDLVGGIVPVSPVSGLRYKRRLLRAKAGF